MIKNTEKRDHNLGVNFRGTFRAMCLQTDKPLFQSPKRNGIEASIFRSPLGQHAQDHPLGGFPHYLNTQIHDNKLTELQQQTKMLHRHRHHAKNVEHLAPETSLLSLYQQQLAHLEEEETANKEKASKTTLVPPTGHNRLIDKYKIPKKGLDPEYTYELIHNELNLDGNPHLNLASFVNTETTEIAQKLIQENTNKNIADNDEYPQLITITQRCIAILAQLWHAKIDCTPIGCSTTGSSEAIMLGGLAMKKRWEQKFDMHHGDKAANLVKRPNIVMSSACQVALEKFARYFEVECRLVPVCQETNFGLDTKLLHEYIDENTIGVYVIMGTTYTGHLENVEDVDKEIAKIEDANPNWFNKPIPIHVDGASGGFVVPFSFAPEQLAKINLRNWCFNNDRVVSVNTSGHKFGLTTAGLGWVLWKDEKFLPQELRFRLKYLGGIEETFNLNFSRPGFQVIHQYFNFISLGHDGYYDRFKKSLFVARVFSYGLLKSPKLAGLIDVISSIHENIEDNSIPTNINDYLTNYSNYKPGLPLVAFKLSKSFNEEYPEIPQALISTLLRNRGWIVPNYPLPQSTDESKNWEVLRIVFRTELKLDLAELLLKDIELIVLKLIHSYKFIKMEILSKDNTSTLQERHNDIYNLLSTLASPEGETDETKEEDMEEIRETVRRNYRGTC